MERLSRLLCCCIEAEIIGDCSSVRSLNESSEHSRQLWFVTAVACHVCIPFASDVDGTLVKSVSDSACKLHKAAFEYSLKAAFNLDTNIDDVKHQGSTDPLIILDLLHHYGLDIQQGMDRMPELIQLMVDHYERYVNEVDLGLIILPGVMQLLTSLKVTGYKDDAMLSIDEERGDVATCLVTGNLQPIGWAKMKRLGMYDLFTPPPFGGFGSDYYSGNFRESWKDRTELIKIAGKKADDIVGNSIVQRFHVGDTPMDMQAAKSAGVVGIGVTTGLYSKAALEEAEASRVLNSLEDIDHVFSIFNLNEHHAIG